MINVFGAFLGSVLGVYILNRFKLNVSKGKQHCTVNKKMSLGFLITAVINLAAVGLGNLTNFLLYCDMKPVALSSDCSAQCSCAESSFQPICDR